MMAYSTNIYELHSNEKRYLEINQWLHMLLSYPLNISCLNVLYWRFCK